MVAKFGNTSGYLNSDFREEICINRPKAKYFTIFVPKTYNYYVEIHIQGIRTGQDIHLRDK